jgi:ComF family protein
VETPETRYARSGDVSEGDPKASHTLAPKSRQRRQEPGPTLVDMLDLLLPQRCLACGAGGTQLCEACLERIPRLRAPLCDRCGAPTAWPVSRCAECSGRRLAFSRARAAVPYNDVVRTMVAAWKERGLRRLASVAADLVVETVPLPDADVIAFIPPDGDRSVKRGHHPVERLARELGERWSLPVERLLRRTRPLDRQSGLARAERRRNVRGAFAAKRVPPRVCLIDDVYTTGATANAASSALRKAGARRVEVVTFARAIRIR